MSLLWKNFQNRPSSGEVTGEKVDCPSTTCHCPAKRWRSHLRSDIWRAGSVVTASYYNSRPYQRWLCDRQVSDWWTISQSWFADRCHQWLNVNHVRRRFVATSFFLVAAGAKKKAYTNGKEHKWKVVNWLMYVVGYRDAQVGWVEVSEDAAARHKTTTELRRAVFLVIYAPRRGLLEVS